jgi:Dihydroprymidine dehydrogenase domain II, 4Fe-4S cluster
MNGKVQSLQNKGGRLQRTDVSDPAYFHKVVDCQWACPAHTPVPEYIRLIAQGRYSDAYMINWQSNAFPGNLGRTCDRPCEPACRRSRVEESMGAAPERVAVCRSKRFARFAITAPRRGKKQTLKDEFQLFIELPNFLLRKHKN